MCLATLANMASNKKITLHKLINLTLEHDRIYVNKASPLAA
jgi:hypothetical protein